MVKFDSVHEQLFEANCFRKPIYHCNFNLKLSSITGSDVLPVDVEVVVSVWPVLFVEEAEGVSEFVDDGPFEDASRSQGDGLLTTINHANVGVASESKAKNWVAIFLTKNMIFLLKDSARAPKEVGLRKQVPIFFILTSWRSYTPVSVSDIPTS